ncbi:hypothetical protein XELAEV_18019051mg [Xenopus laevis]|uniref:Uncharacterized protein n=1 Tax=Xenopus laevis TaxID=8355 RepID=A0A974HU13_XENLA|nr:hypothetical protein XELAEV_18019051mg [Xenopus laevis]
MEQPAICLQFAPCLLAQMDCCRFRYWEMPPIITLLVVLYFWGGLPLFLEKNTSLSIYLSFIPARTVKYRPGGNPMYGGHRGSVNRACSFLLGLFLRLQMQLSPKATSHPLF